MKFLADGVWQTSRQQFVKNHSQRIDIAARVEIERIGQRLLGTHVCQGPDQLPDVGLQRRPRVTVGRSRDTEIQNLGLAGIIDQDVARFEIAVNQAALMRVVYRVADLHHDLQTLTDVQVVRFGIIPRRFAADEFHCEVGLRAKAGVHGTGFVDLSDAGMLQPAERLRFLFKSSYQFVAYQARLDDLESNSAAR